MNEKTELTAADFGLIIGCECQLFWPNLDGSFEYERNGVLCGVRPEDEHRNGLLFSTISANGWPQELAYKYSESKPILRPMSDMTETELLEFAKICSGADSFRIGKAVANNYKLVVCIFGEGFGKSVENLMVNENGETWYTSYFNDDENGGRNVINQHQQTIWLLSRHFDIFGWISAGLAIDKTKT